MLLSPFVFFVDPQFILTYSYIYHWIQSFFQLESRSTKEVSFILLALTQFVSVTFADSIDFMLLCCSSGMNTLKNIITIEYNNRQVLDQLNSTLTRIIVTLLTSSCSTFYDLYSDTSDRTCCRSHCELSEFKPFIIISTIQRERSSTGSSVLSSFSLRIELS